MARLTKRLEEQFGDSARLDDVIRQNLKELGYVGLMARTADWRCCHCNPWWNAINKGRGQFQWEYSLANT